MKQSINYTIDDIEYSFYISTRSSELYINAQAIRDKIIYKANNIDMTLSHWDALDKFFQNKSNGKNGRGQIIIEHDTIEIGLYGKFSIKLLSKRYKEMLKLRNEIEKLRGDVNSSKWEISDLKDSLWYTDAILAITYFGVVGYLLARYFTDD